MKELGEAFYNAVERDDHDLVQDSVVQHDNKKAERLWLLLKDRKGMNKKRFQALKERILGNKHNHEPSEKKQELRSHEQIVLETKEQQPKLLRIICRDNQRYLLKIE